MVEMMSKRMTIGVNHFYGPQKTSHSSRTRKERSSGDENQSPDRRAAHSKTSKTPLCKTSSLANNSSPGVGSTEKIYSGFPNGSQISPQEMSRLSNGLSKKELKSRRDEHNYRLNGDKTCLERRELEVKKMRVDMKKHLHEVNGDAGTPDKRTRLQSPQQNHQKITHYFQPKTPLNEDNENIENIPDELFRTPTKGCNDETMKTPLLNDSPVVQDWWTTSASDGLVIENGLEVFDVNCPMGLKNLGNTCYMNSVLQCVFALNFFISDLDTSFAALTTHSDFPMTQSLLDLFRQFDGLRKEDKEEKTSAEELTSCLSHLKSCVGKKSNPFLSCSQQDAAEFFTHVIDTIAEEFESWERNPIWEVFGSETTGLLKCKSCENETKIDNEKFHALYLSVPDDRSLTTAFQDFLRDETTGHQCVADNCKANENVLRKSFVKRPKVLFLQLGRYTANGNKRVDTVLIPRSLRLSTRHVVSGPSSVDSEDRPKLQDVCNNVSKVVRRISFDESFDEQQSIENKDPTEVEDVTDDAIAYQLVAVICHHGCSLSAGHYTSFVYNSQTDRWFSCDDNRICLTDFEAVQRDSQKRGYCYVYVS